MKQQRSMRGWLIGLFVALAAIALACGSPIKPGKTTGDVVPKTTVPVASDRTTVPVCPDECYKDADQEKFWAQSFAGLWNGFYADKKRKYDQLGKYSKPSLVIVPSGKNIETKCTESNFISEMAKPEITFQWCGWDNTVYIGSEIGAKIMATGDAGAQAALAHEMGHQLQTSVGINNSGQTADEIKIENQMDCAAGAALQAVRLKNVSAKQRKLDNASVQELFKFLDPYAKRRNALDPNYGKNRINVFNDGVKGGLQACNKYFPKFYLYKAGQK